MDLRNNLISICSTINIFLYCSYSIEKSIMSINNTNRLGLTKKQINEVIPAHTNISKKYVSYIRELKSPPPCIANMLKDLADAIFNSSTEDKEFNLNL